MIPCAVLHFVLGSMIEQSLQNDTILNVDFSLSPGFSARHEYEKGNES